MGRTYARMGGAPTVKLTMYWDDAAETPGPYRIPDDVVDLVFKVRGRSLPRDYAQSLADAVTRHLPWLTHEPHVGIQLAAGAEEGNGWYRDDQAETLYMSRRTRLVLRLPKGRFNEALCLQDLPIDVGGHGLILTDPGMRPLSPLTTLYARFVLGMASDEEPVFLASVQQELQEMGVVCKKMVCGKVRRFVASQGDMFARSLMLLDLSIAESITVQQRGVGPARHLGCGLFIPCKSVG